MERDSIVRRLHEVEGHIATGEGFIAQARNRLERADELKLDPAEGAKVIEMLLGVQQQYLTERDAAARADELIAVIARSCE